MQDAQPLRITVADLKASLGSPHVRLIDARPPAEYAAGHVAGAVNFDPFPPYATTDTSPAGLSAFFRMMSEVFGRLGIAPASRVICYDATSGVRAARLVWLLHAMRHADAVIVDGGMQAWQAAGYPVDEAVPEVTPTTFTPRLRESLVAGFERVLDGISDPKVVLWDVRSEGEHYGETVRAKRGGTIPGSIHYEWTNNLDGDGRFKDLEVIRKELEARGITPEKEIIPF